MNLTSRYVFAAALSCVMLSGCSLRQAAVDRIGSALASGGSSWARDDDPDLIRDASPFALKTIESLLEEAPQNRDLLLAATRGFTQYSFAFVVQDADAIEPSDLQRATYLRARARKLYMRAVGYGIRGLDIDFPGWRNDPAAAIPKMRREQVPLLFWTAIAWGGAMSVAKDDSELTADLGLVEQMMKRAMELDESYELGSIHDFYIVYEGGRPASAGGSIVKAREHLSKARELSKGLRAAPLVTFAETVCVSTQDKKEFESLLNEALAVDPDKAPDQRLNNLIYQKRARMLLARVDELFAE